MAAEDYFDLDAITGETVDYLRKTSTKIALRNHGMLWTTTENTVLKNSVRKGIAWVEVARRLGRTERACRMQAERLGLMNPNQPDVAIQSKGLNVNHMHLITLLQEGYTTCSVVLQEHDSYVQMDKAKAYTYKMTKDAGIAAGDRVVVYARDQLKVGRVAEVHEEPQIDFKAPYALKWIVQKVDLAAYDEHTAKEAAALAHLTSIQRKKDQEKMLQELFGGEEGLADLKRLING